MIRFIWNSNRRKALEMVKSGCLTFFGPKNVKTQKLHKICSIDFPKYFVMTSIQKEVTFVRTILIMPKGPFFRRFRVQFWHVSYFMFRCFLFLDIFTVGTGVPLLLRICWFLYCWLSWFFGFFCFHYFSVFILVNFRIYSLMNFISTFLTNIIRIVKVLNCIFIWFLLPFRNYLTLSETILECFCTLVHKLLNCFYCKKTRFQFLFTPFCYTVESYQGFYMPLFETLQSDTRNELWLKCFHYVGRGNKDLNKTASSLIHWKLFDRGFQYTFNVDNF